VPAPTPIHPDRPPSDSPAWHALAPDQAVRHLESHAERGLPADAAIPDQAGVTDLAAALGGEPPSLPVLLATILGEFHRLFDTYAAAGFPALRGAWEQRNAFAELPVAVRGESATLQGTCAGVDDDGALLLRTGDGVQRVLAGDVSLRPLLDGSR